MDRLTARVRSWRCLPVVQCSVLEPAPQRIGLDSSVGGLWLGDRIPSLQARSRRVVSITAALLVGLLLCEAGLRLVGLAYLKGTERGVRSADELGPQGKDLVCLGDSNTFGLWLEGEDSYPSRLQDLLDEHVTGGPHRVVNLGIPGLNSAHLRDALPGALAEYEPDGVLVLVGFNDRWSWSPDFEDAAILVHQPWYEELRLAKLLRLIFGATDDGLEIRRDARERGLEGGIDRTGREFLFEPADYDRPREPETVRRSLAAALRDMCSTAEEAGTPIYLLTYASGREAYELANAAARDVAADGGARLIDARAWFEGQGVSAGGELFFDDGHPRAVGYEVFARLVFNGLVEHGAIQSSPMSMSAVRDDLVSRAPAPTLEVDLAEGVLVVRGELPGRKIVMLLSGGGEGPPAKLAGVTLPLIQDGLFSQTLADTSLRGVVDEEGLGTISIAHLLRSETLSGEMVMAVCLTGTVRQAELSAATEFRMP